MPKKYVKKITAGNLIKIMVCTHPTPQDGRRQRAAKCKATSAAQQAINNKTAREDLELLAAANPDLQLFVTLTYEQLPAADTDSARRAALKSNIKNFIRTIRTVRGRRRELLKYIYVTEGHHGNTRPHHHLLINAADPDQLQQIREELQSLWKHGHVDIERIFTGDNTGSTYEDIARYMTKENFDNRPNGAQLWTCSRNLNRPKIDTYYIAEDTTIAPPPGSRILDGHGEQIVNEYGSFAYYKYMLLPGCTGYIPDPGTRRGCS